MTNARRLIELKSPAHLQVAGLAVLVLLTCSWLYGLGILNPRFIAWLMQGDSAQHMVGLSYFLAEPWQWPAGMIQGLGQASSVVYTDSIGWLAIVLKLLGWPADWQPFGLWMWLCHLLIAGLAWHWLANMGVAAWPRVLGAWCLAFAPVVLLRAYGHESLMAHWVLLAAFVLLQSDHSPGRWLVLLLLALGLHPYWVAMLLPFWLLSALRGATTGLRSRVLEGFGLAILSVFAAYGLGYGESSASPLAAQGFGTFSANLLSWFDPMDWQLFLQTFGRDPAPGREWSVLGSALGYQIGRGTIGQYEGFAWLGLGLWMLVAIGLFGVAWTWIRVRFYQRRDDQHSHSVGQCRQHFVWGPTVFVALLMMVWSFSNQWFVGSRLVWSYALPEPLLALANVFRASGRFIWPATWLLMLWAIWRVSRDWPRLAVGLVGLAAVFQFVDLSAKFGEFRDRFTRQMPGAASMPQSSVWSEVLAGPCKRLQFVMPGAVGEDAHWAPVAVLAARAGVALAYASVARPSQQDLAEQFKHAQDLTFSQQRWPEDRLLVSWPSALPGDWRESLQSKGRDQMKLGLGQWFELDGYWLWQPANCAAGGKR